MEKAAFYQRVILGMAILICLPVIVSAQTAETPFHTQPYEWRSAVYNGDVGRPGRTFLAESHTVRVPGAPWLRLQFGEAQLGAGSFITITSLQDGARQRLDATSLRQWYNTSAYFNGDALEIELHVVPNDRGIFLSVRGIMVGDVVTTESQCGTTDDRVPSSHPAVGRLLTIGCTGWIIANGLHVTAGHCSTSSATTLEFNVPLSLPNGAIQHPPPEDQYSVDASSRVFVNGGVGNDWGTFEVFNNSNTGLQPIQAQGASFTVVQNLGPPTIRITGYGVDSGTSNQIQQTSTGPNAGSSGTTMRYRTDTEGGNSGSPVIDEATGNAVGVHTHGGCTSRGGNNSGTATTNTAFWNALNVSPPETGTIAGMVTNANTGQPINGATVMVDTGESDTTDVNGEYSIPNVAVGMHSVTASATGFQSQTQNATVNADQTTMLDFALSPQVGPTQAIVDCITYTTSGFRGRNLRVMVTIVNDLGNVVSGASVTAKVTFPSGSMMTRTGTTNSSGNITFQFNSAPAGCYRTDVTNVVASGLTFDGTEPPNGFQKGTDATPDADCRSGSDDCGGVPF